MYHVRCIDNAARYKSIFSNNNQDVQILHVIYVSV